MNSEYLVDIKPKFIDYIRMNFSPIKTTKKILDASDDMSISSSKRFQNNWLKKPNRRQAAITLAAMSIFNMGALVVHTAFPEIFGSGQHLIDFAPFIPTAIASLGLVKPAISGTMQLLHN